MKLGTEEDTGDGADVEGGMDYKDYVRMLLFLEDKGKLTVRTMGVIEKDMQTVYRQPSFRIDYCVGRMEVDTVCKLRRGISYRFRHITAISSEYKNNNMRRIKMPFQVSLEIPEI